MTRMFLAVPRDPVVPEGHTVTFLPDGTMLDTTQDARCATCVHHESDGRCHVFWNMVELDDPYVEIWTCTPDDFGCKAWQSKDVTETLNDVQQTSDTPCPTCKGTGYLEHINWHDTEVWDCPDCKGDK